MIDDKNYGYIPSPKRVGHANTYQNTSGLDSPVIVSLPEDGGIHNRSATADDLLDHIHLGMRGYQAYWLPASALDPWLVYFPFAWYMDKDTRILNRTNGAEYYVKSVEDRVGENVVKLAGGSHNTPLKEGDVLEIDMLTGSQLRYIHAYPNADDINRYVTEEEIARNQTEGWNDTIAYKMKKLEPAAIKGVKQLKRRFMDEEVNPQTGMIEREFMDHYSASFTFQCWTRTNERTARLANWFRTFMRSYCERFRFNGVQNITFERQSEEYNVTRWRNDIVGATLMYSAIIQEFEYVSVTQLKSFECSVNVLNGKGESIGFKNGLENI